jgi:hypothetical protein
MRAISLPRRVLLGVASLAVVPYNPFPASADSRDSISRKLSRVPVFVIANKDSSPYLTEVDAEGKRSGFFYLGPQQAVAALTDIRAYDPRASLNVLSLDSVFFSVAQSAEEAAAAPQPKAGTSTDMRLFRLAPLPDETGRANQKLPGSKRLAADEVPLFYDSTFFLDVDGRTEQPHFFRLADLTAAYQQSQNSQLKEPPSLEVTTLSKLVKSLEKRDLKSTLPVPILVAASEASAVVDRMGTATADSAGGSAAPSQESPVQQRPSDGADDLYLNVPFGGGGRKGF